MPTLRHKLKNYFKNKNDNLARELATELYMLLYKSKNGSPVSFDGILIDFKQDEEAINADIFKIYYILKTKNTSIEV
jgi:hypothetical protein